MHEPLIQNIFVCINTQDMSAEITVYMTFPARYQLYKLFNISIKQMYATGRHGIFTK